MTMEAIIDRPARVAHCGVRPAEAQKARSALETRIERLKAELTRQGDLMSGACMISEELRGLALMFHGVFCDPAATEDEEFRLQRTSAAYLVEKLLKRLAERLETAEDHARTSRIHALAEGA